MARTLLPTWAIYRQTLALDAKEPKETFAWIPDASDRELYEEAKKGLDMIPDSRAWITTITGNPYENPELFQGMGYTILSSLGSRHSGSSATHLMWRYQYLLKNWDAFVQEMKTQYAHDAYRRRQLTHDDVDCMRTMPLAEFRARYAITCDDAVMHAMIKELAYERAQDRIQRQAEHDRQHFEGRIGVLKHHYDYPSRWKDSKAGSALFGLPSQITEKMFEAMEVTHPDYRAHIAKVKAWLDNKIETPPSWP